jgi:hypothetical protein
MNRPDPMLTHTFTAGIVLSALAWSVGGRAVGSAAVAGALFALSNVAAFRFVVRRMLAAQRSGALIALKMVGTLTIVYVLERTLGLDPAGLAIGYGALVIGLLSAAFRQSLLAAASRQTAPTLRSTEI